VKPLRKLGFLTIGLFDEADPGRGHESTLHAGWTCSKCL